jgi:uncharacterized protein
MKFLPDAVTGPSITAYGAGWVAINGEQIHSSVVVSSFGNHFSWNCADYDALQAQHFTQLAELGAELILFGSGAKIRFPQPHWLQALYARQIGVETMDTQAACRTFNFLSGEGRKVVAALLL